MSRERFLSDVELEAFLRAVRERHHKNQPRDYAFFVLIANSAIRPSEARALKRADVHTGRDPWIQLHREAKRHAPQPVNRLPIHPAVASIVKRWSDHVEKESPLFSFSKRQSARLFHYYAALAGLPRHFKVYSLRHTAGMRLWRYTKDLRLLQAIMGHHRLKASSAYVHLSPDIIRDGMEAVVAGGC